MMISLSVPEFRVHLHDGEAPTQPGHPTVESWIGKRELVVYCLDICCYSSSFSCSFGFYVSFSSSC